MVCTASPRCSIHVTGAFSIAHCTYPRAPTQVTRVNKGPPDQWTDLSTPLILIHVAGESFLPEGAGPSLHHCDEPGRVFLPGRVGSLVPRPKRSSGSRARPERQGDRRARTFGPRARPLTRQTDDPVQMLLAVHLPIDPTLEVRFPRTGSWFPGIKALGRWVNRARVRGRVSLALLGAPVLSLWR